MSVMFFIRRRLLRSEAVTVALRPKTGVLM
jgi:hypothetical protein